MMGAGGITNVGPINTQTTGKGAIMGFDPILGMSRRCLLYTSPSPRDGLLSRMPSSA